MFTGLIEATGTIETLQTGPTGGRLEVRTALAGDLQSGDSIAVNGCCLTVIDGDASRFGADLSPATLAATTFGGLEPGRLVNLERPVRADARLGGHFVLGHVDATGRIDAFRPDGDAFWLEVEIPAVLDPLVIPKGSVAIDGISLTIAALLPGRLAVQIIPFTRAHTSLSAARPGDRVNLEADVLGKYVARLLAARPESAGEGALVSMFP